MHKTTAFFGFVFVHIAHSLDLELSLEVEEGAIVRLYHTWLVLGECLALRIQRLGGPCRACSASL